MIKIMIKLSRIKSHLFIWYPVSVTGNPQTSPSQTQTFDQSRNKELKSTFAKSTSHFSAGKCWQNKRKRKGRRREMALNYRNFDWNARQCLAYWLELKQSHKQTGCEDGKVDKQLMTPLHAACAVCPLQVALGVIHSPPNCVQHPLQQPATSLSIIPTHPGFVCSLVCCRPSHRSGKSPRTAEFRSSEISLKTWMESLDDSRTLQEDFSHSGST